jgi:hypothetical protein
VSICGFFRIVPAWTYPDNPVAEFSLSSSEEERVGVRRLLSALNPLTPALSPSDGAREKRRIRIGS